MNCFRLAGDRNLLFGQQLHEPWILKVRGELRQPSISLGVGTLFLQAVSIFQPERSVRIPFICSHCKKARQNSSSSATQRARELNNLNTSKGNHDVFVGFQP
jgi:hypothetical protein